MRKAIFWLHLAAGLIAGSIVLIMSVTGVLLAFEAQIVERAERGFRCEPPRPTAVRLSAETLLAQVLATQPTGALSGLTLRSEPGAPATVSFGRDVTFFVDPYSGAVLGEGARQLRAFFHAVTDWHRWLAREGDSRATGRAITGACNLAFLALVVSGFYLWWPRKWSVAIFLPRLRLSGKVRDFNWHNALGFWSALPLFFIVFTGVLMSYPWATNLLYRATGNDAPPPQPPRPAGGARGEGGNRAPSFEGLDQLWKKAEQQVPGWRLISVRFASSPKGPVTFMVDRGPRGRPDLRAMLTLDPKTAEIVKWEPFASYNLGRQLRTWGRWVHTGEAGGIVGQLVAGIATAGAAVLVWTGFALSWRRFFPKKNRVGEPEAGN